MRRTGALLLALSKDWLRNKEAVFFALLFPIILLVIFSTVFAGGSAEFTVYVQNNDIENGEPTALSEALVESLNETDALTVRELDADRNVSTWAREDDSRGSKRVLVIPDGFAHNVQASAGQARIDVTQSTVSQFQDRLNDSDRARIERGLDRAGGNNSTVAGAEVTLLTASDDEAAPAVRGVVDSVVSGFNDEAVGIEEPPSRVTTGNLSQTSLGSVDYYLPAFIAAVVMINGLITMTTVVAGFNSDGTLKRLVATPLRKRDWILANVIQQTLLALVVTGVMVLVAHLLFGVTAVPGPLSLSLIVLGALTFAGLGMVLGSFVEDADVATSLGNAIAFPMMFLAGVFWEIELMPDYLQTVAELLPLYHFHRGLRQLMILETTEGTMIPFAFLGASAVLSVGLAVAVTGWRDFGD